MAADRTDSFLFSIQAIKAAFDMHEPVFAAAYGRKDQGFNQFALDQFGTADRAGLRRARIAYSPGAELEPWFPR